MHLLNYLMLERCVTKIFSEAGFSKNQQVETVDGKGDIDIVAEKDNVKYCVEVKYSLVNDRAAVRITDIAKNNKMMPVLVVAEYVNSDKRAYYKEKFSELVLIDISNLLFWVKDDEELRNELISCLNYSIDSIEPKPIDGFVDMIFLKHTKYTQSLIREMELCKTGKTMARTYEVLCHKLLENIFAEDLTLWREQQKSNKDLYKFDLLCRIKENNQKTFWSVIERYFNSKYIIFEFKNYNEPITQKEIYTTEKYLYAKALRCVAIIISQNGYSENAYWASKGCLRESGKLLILLDTNDLIEMNKMKENLDDPSDYLLSKLDDILMELEK